MRPFHYSIIITLGFAAGCALAAEPLRRGPANADEPWLFRTVLDDRPRVAVAALGDSLWAAWDTQRCRLYQAWQPRAAGVKLSGAVFDGKHGPQPVTDGTPWLHEPAEAAWFIDNKIAPIRYLGHRVGAPGEATFRYQVTVRGAEVSIEESPRLDGGGTGLVRTFRVLGIPDGSRLALNLGDSAWSASGAAVLERSGSSAQLVFTTDGTSKLVVAAPYLK